jgi:tetratricopeptide (TPR) repeat protein
VRKQAEEYEKQLTAAPEDKDKLKGAAQSYVVRRRRLSVSKPELKAHLVHRLKLKCDEPVADFAFNFNLRRYNMVLENYKSAIPLLQRLLEIDPSVENTSNLVGRCRLTL